MLPYQDDAKKLEELLDRLFNDESPPEDVTVFKKPSLPGPRSGCCSYSYGSV